MNQKTRELELEELKKAAGGHWDRSTLTPSELAEFDSLWAAYTALPFGSPEAEQAYAAFCEFCTRLNEKYNG